MKQFDVYLSYSEKSMMEAAVITEILLGRGINVWTPPRTQLFAELHQLLDQYFNREEVITLCFTLEVDFDNLGGQTKEGKLRELITHLYRRQRISDLFEVVKEDRPNISWDRIAEGFQNAEEISHAVSPEEIVQSTKSIVVLVGPYNLPWKNPEIEACIREFFVHEAPIFLVTLAGAPNTIELPYYLSGCIQVDLRKNLEGRGLSLLIYHIRGAENVLQGDYEIIETLAERQSSTRIEIKEQIVDAWGIGSVKNRIHFLSEIIAREAADAAREAAKTYEHNALTILVPLLVDFRWKRGYAVGLSSLLNPSKPVKILKDFKCKEASPACPVMEGVVSAKQHDIDQVLILLDDNPAILVYDVGLSELPMILDAFNNFGRLPAPSAERLSLLERMYEIPIEPSSQEPDDITAVLFRNIDVLIPLVARWGMPGSEWLLPNEDGHPVIGRELLDDIHSSQSKMQLERPSLNDDDIIVEEFPL